jgi:hypothetical protein
MAARASAKKTAVATGRRIVLTTLRAPSTATFAADVVVGECSSGYVMTAHDVDAQNAFGAMIRNRVCPKFNPTTQRIVVSRDDDGVHVDVSCDTGVWTCDTMNRWQWTIGF